MRTVVPAAFISSRSCIISSAVLLLGAEMNAVIEHMSAEGKNPGEKTFDESDDSDPKQHVSGLGRDHSLKATSDET